MTPMTPKVIARPIAASSNTEPSERPYQAFCSALQNARLSRILPPAELCGLAHGGRKVSRQAVDEPERVLVAAVADHGNGGDLVLGARLGRIKDGGGAGLVKGFFDARVRLFLERLVDIGQGTRIARLEDRLGGVEAPAGLLGHQSERAECGIEHSAHTIVEPHFFDIGGRGRDRCAAGGVGQLFGFVLDEDALGIRRIEQALILEGFQQRARAGITARGQRIDGIGGIAKGIGREARERILIRAGTGQGCPKKQEAYGEYKRQRAIVKAMHCISSGLKCATGGGGRPPPPPPSAQEA